MNPSTPTRWLGAGRFQIIRALGEGGMGIVFEALDHQTHSRVALKTVKTPDPTKSFQLKWEFRSLAQLSHINLIQLYELVADGNECFFTMELLESALDFISYLHHPSVATLRSPEQACPSQPRQERRPCRINGAWARSFFLQLCEGVGCLHGAHKLHRDIKPSNALITAQGRVVLLDFGLVSEMARTSYPAFTPQQPSETTSGSLIGTIGYMSPEQAAGQPLGPASDCYAIGVMLFEALTGRLPFLGTASAVIHAKQHFEALLPSHLVSGIPDDLDALCRSLLRRDARQRPTIRDLTRFFASGPSANEIECIPADAPFLGRHQELARLQHGLQRVRHGQGTVLQVRGASGAGKSALIEQFLRHASAAGTAVFAGRCHENESVPFKAVDALVDSLTCHLVTMDGDLHSLLPDGIIDLAQVFPVLLRLPAVAARCRQGGAHPDPFESRTQAFTALTMLLGHILARRTVILAIDDLQWSDSESCALIRHLLEHLRPPRLLLLLIHRPDEPCRNRHLHGLLAWLAHGSTGMDHATLEVGGLSSGESYLLACTLLGTRMPDAQAMARRFTQECGGSALFLGELVRHALTVGSTGALEAINLHSVIGRRIDMLSEHDRLALELICIAGSPVRIITVRDAMSVEQDFLKTVSHLRAIKLIRLDGLRSADAVEPYHDQVRLAVVDRIPAEQRTAQHARLARAIEANQPQELDALAEHFRRAGLMAHAYRYSLMAADQAIGKHAVDHAERMLLQAWALAADASQQEAVAVRLIHFYTDLARFTDAYDIARRALRTVSQRLPGRFCTSLFVVDWLAVEIRLRHYDMDQLLTLAATDNVRVTSAIRIMNAVAKAAYQIEPGLCIWIAARIVGLCLKHGNTPDCAIGYLVFGAIFKGGLLRNYAVGHAFGRLSSQLVDRYGTVAQQAEVEFVVGYFAIIWTRPYVQAEQLWAQAYRSGQATGDRFHTGCAAAATIMSMFFRGAALSEILIQARLYEVRLAEMRLREPLAVLSIITQAIRCLQGSTVSALSFSDAAFNEEDLVAQLPHFGSRHFARLYFIVKMQTLFLHQDIERALAMVTASEVYAKETEGMIQQSEHAFYAGLIACAAMRWQLARPRRLRRMIRRIRREYRLWASQCPENYLARHQLLEAEMASVHRQDEQALHGYALAATTASAHGQAYLTGLINSLHANQLSDRGCHGEAEALRREAALALFTWGATALAEGMLRTVMPLSARHGNNCS